MFFIFFFFKKKKRQWGSKSCIYLIEYKHDPLIYYIGRTSLFKRRFYNHLKADSGNKLHIFLKLVAWEHFNLSILELCCSEEQGARENFYLQKYLPLLNSAFSSSFTESAINKTLKDKLDTLKASKSIAPRVSKSIPHYVYDIHDKGINKTYVSYQSLKDASLSLGINVASLSHYRNTDIPFRGKLVYTEPLVDFNLAFESSKKNTHSDLVNRILPIKVWAYDAKSLKLIEGSPFDSKTQASKSIGISRNVIYSFLDTGRAEGVKGTYLYSRPLNEEIKNFLQVSGNLKLGNKVRVWAYDANTLELINNSPFSSLINAANYYNINYRTINRHLDTKLATVQNKTLVYFFSKEPNSEVKAELLRKPTRVGYARTEIWVYKQDDKGGLTRIPNQPFKTKREAIRVLGIHISVLNTYLDSSEIFRDLLFFTCSRD